jgi:hypothetical protein
MSNNFASGPISAQGPAQWRKLCRPGVQIDRQRSANARCGTGESDDAFVEVLHWISLPDRGTSNCG